MLAKERIKIPRHRSDGDTEARDGCAEALFQYERHAVASRVKLDSDRDDGVHVSGRTGTRQDDPRHAGTIYSRRPPFESPRRLV